MIFTLIRGIETSFRELKYTIGLTNFHGKKVEFVTQEIFARLIMYNFCETITSHVIIQKTVVKHPHKVNFTMAVKICKNFFRASSDMTPPVVEAQIQKYTLPVREGRSDPRKIIPKSAVSFVYRVA